ncbi:MAG: hypothetical protein QM601_08865 [Pseudoxanthomonas sp.]
MRHRPRASLPSVVLEGSLALAGLATPARAQDVLTDDSSRSKDLSALIVTGERGGTTAAAADSAVPVTLPTGEDLRRTGKTGTRA